MDHPALCTALKIRDEEQIEALRRRLGAMCRDGQLLQNRRNGFVPAHKGDVIKAKCSHIATVLAFCALKMAAKICFSAREMHKVFDGDTVLTRSAQRRQTHCVGSAHR